MRNKGFVWFDGISTIVGYLMPYIYIYIYMKQFYFKQFSLVQVLFLFTQLNFKTVLFQTIHFIISTQFSSIGPIDRTLSGATTHAKCGPGNDCNEGVLHIPQSSSITGTSPSDCLVSFSGHSLVGWGSYPSTEKKSFYSTDPVAWARKREKEKEWNKKKLKEGRKKRFRCSVQLALS